MTDPNPATILAEWSCRRMVEGLPPLTERETALAKQYLADFEKIETERKVAGLPSLTPEQAARRGVVDAQRDLLSLQVQVARETTARLIPLRVGLLLAALAILLSTCSRILLR